jgi:phosphate uptake regulator
VDSLGNIRRKRVTRVGSGAFSIYLPKKWIDSWPEAQQKSREVDLHLINDALMIVPAHMEQSVELHVDDNTEAIRGLLRSAYVRGVDRIQLTPKTGTFGAETIASSRDLLRHLDERLIVTTNPEEITFALNPDLPAPVSDGADLLRILTAKVREMVDLCEQAVETHLMDSDRSLHAMALLVSTQQDDVRRIFHQSLRMVARIELPMTSVSDFQVLDLVAADLERFGSHLVRIVEILLADLGLTVEDLAFPRSHLIEKLGELPIRNGVVQELVRNYTQGFKAISVALIAIMDAIHNRDIAAISTWKNDILAQQDAMAARFFATIAEHWGEDIPAEQAVRVFTMARVASLLADLAHVLQNTCHHALILLAAEPRQETS